MMKGAEYFPLLFMYDHNPKTVIIKNIIKWYSFDNYIIFFAIHQYKKDSGKI